MRVAVVSEFYPRARDPVLGIWAHRQALAARDAGADVHVLVLERPVPPRDAPDKLAALRAMVDQPRNATIDGLPVTYVPFLAPPRWRTYDRWGAWAAPAAAFALRKLRRRGFGFQLIHAHNAVPAGEAVRRGRFDVPLVVSVHGGDVLWTAPKLGDRAIRRTYAAADLVLANSSGIEALARRHGARRSRVLHLGTDIPAVAPAHDPGTIVTVGHLVARKRHADVIRALPDGARYLIVGDGPERGPLERLARDLGKDVEFAGQLAPDEALRRARTAAVFAMPSTEEAFGVAYVEAMAAGLPAVGRRGEPGPEEIAKLGGGLLLAADDDLDAALRLALDDREALGAAARETVRRHFTWERCGAETVAAYRSVL